MNRRSFIQRAAAASAVAPIAASSLPGTALASANLSRLGGFADISIAKDWNDPAAWPDGKVPGPADKAVVNGPVILRNNARVAGVDIADTGSLFLDPAANVLLESSRNIVVMGLLSLRPTPAVKHTVRFVDVDENAFVGGGMEVLGTDVGIWVRHMGLLDAVGTPKVAWNRTGDDPSWNNSDELIVTPTAPGDWTSFKSFTKGSAVPKGLGMFPAEVLNLTRNVIIEGTPGGRAHINFHVDRPQTMQYVEVRHMGPRQPGEKDPTEGVLGRYPVHFHHSGDATRGTLIEGVVVHHSGNRAFVPHGSHGITLRNCVAYDIFDSAFWWDLPKEGNVENRSHDSVWDSCVAAKVQSDPVFRGFTLSGFTLGSGERNTCRNSVAVGIMGNEGAAGFRWPPKGNQLSGVWEFTNNVAHNVKRHGIGVWQNTSAPHTIVDTLVYCAGGSAIDHGAYRNGYSYNNFTAYDCEHVVTAHALSNADGLEFRNIFGHDIRGAHVRSVFHQLPGYPAVFVGGNLDSFDVDNNPRSSDTANVGFYDFVDTAVSPDKVRILSAQTGTTIRIQNGAEAVSIDHSGQVSTIAPFHGDVTSEPPPTTTTTTTQPPATTTTTQPPATTTTQPPATTTTQPPATTQPLNTTTTTTQPSQTSDKGTSNNKGGRRRRKRRQISSRTDVFAHGVGSSGLPDGVARTSAGVIETSRASAGLGALNAPTPLGAQIPTPGGSAGLGDTVLQPLPLTITATAAAVVFTIRRRMSLATSSASSGALGTSVTQRLMSKVADAYDMDSDD